MLDVVTLDLSPSLTITINLQCMHSNSALYLPVPCDPIRTIDFEGKIQKRSHFDGEAS